jgi:polyhydroxybutyrate depolymerase
MNLAQRVRELFAAVAGALVVAAASTAMAAEACQPERPLAAGLSEHHVDSGDRTRRYLLYVPRTYTGETTVPVVLDLHASGITPEVELQVTGMDRAAEEKGFIIVLPEAVRTLPQGGTTWNVPFEDGRADDVAFIGQVLDTVSEVACIDTKRVFATGFSGGGRFASELACRIPRRFAAISAVGGLRHPEGREGECRSDGHAVSIIAFHSLDDPVNPYDGESANSPTYWTYGVEEAVTRWAEWMDCPAPAGEQLSKSVRRQTYLGCRGGASLEFYRLSGSGHTWPGSRFQFPGSLGATDAAIDATVLSVQFFERFHLPGD